MGFENMNRPGSGADQKIEKSAKEQEAKLETNMMKAKLNERLGFGKELTKEDYDVALQELNELKALAEKDPEGLEKLMQYAGRSAIGVAAAFGTLGALAEETLVKAGLFEGKEDESFMGGEGKGYADIIEKKADFMKKLFTKDSEVLWNDAQRQLKALQSEAERIAEDESSK